MPDPIGELGETLARNWMSFVGVGLLAIVGLIQLAGRSMAQGRLAFSDYRRADISPSYRDRRARDLGQTPTALGLTDLGEEPVAYGVVFDFGELRALTTLTAFLTGEASVYLSDGRVMARADQSLDPDAAGDAARALVQEAQTRLRWMHLTGRFPLPRMGRAKLYVLTPQGVFSEDVRIDPVEPPLQAVWNAGQELLDEMTDANRLPP